MSFPRDFRPCYSLVLISISSLCLSYSALVESDFVLGIDCDVSALEQATTNIRDIEVDDRVFLIRGTVDLPLESKRSGTYGSRGRGKSRQSSNKGGRINKTGGRNEHFAPGPSTCNSPDTDDMTTNNTNSRFPVLDNCIDTVVTNPPFGTKPDKAGIDVQFVKLGCRLARRAVYSFHKTSTRDFILRTMGDLPSVASVTVIAEMKFDLPQTYRFHQKASVDVAVDLIRVELIQEADKHDHDAHNTTSLNSEIGSDDGYADSEIDL